MAGPAVLPREAIAFLRAKGLKPSRHWLSVWREEHASAFAVAQMTRQDLLRQTHRELQRVLRKGETFESFQERLQPWLQEKGWAPTGRGGDIPKRLRRIYHTNLRTAHLAGQWDRIQRTKQLLPWLVYGLGPSEVHREQHAAWAGLCLRVDDPFWRTHMPPNGWGCKCWVRQVAEPPAGATTKAPRVETRPWTNPATGETVHVPRGIDPGWDYNAAEHAGLGTVQALTDRVQRLAAPPAFPQARLDDLEGRLQAAQRKYRERYSPDDKPAIDRAAADYRRAWDALPEPVLSADSGAGRAARRRRGASWTITPRTPRGEPWRAPGAPWKISRNARGRSTATGRSGSSCASRATAAPSTMSAAWSTRCCCAAAACAPPAAPKRRTRAGGRTGTRRGRIRRSICPTTHSFASRREVLPANPPPSRTSSATPWRMRTTPSSARPSRSWTGATKAPTRPLPGYDPTELYRPGFGGVGKLKGAEYAGKIYDAGFLEGVARRGGNGHRFERLGDGAPIGATEVISMGLEQMHADPLVFAIEDSEWFEFILTRVLFRETL